MASNLDLRDPDLEGEQPEGTVRVAGKGYVPIAVARAYAAAGLAVDWGTRQPERDKIRPLQYKENDN